MLKAFQIERERSKQPGYVCTYDDYDGGDESFVAPSYTQVATEMGAGQRTYRTTRGTPVKEKTNDFGAGVA